MSEKGCRKEKNQNIQVFVRLRPLNQREQNIKSMGVVEVNNGREVIVRQSHQCMHNKRFTFDRAFPPHSKQVEVYQEVVSPLIEEVLAGYNCTVFAYGQTGTGKTHTMVGEATGDESSWQTDPLSGIIPRALSQLFDELRISNTEYTIRVSYLELYNEELFDLLTASEENSKLRIYEDVTRKGSNIVNGLEEITVYNKNEVYKIMEQGQERKRVASTLMNAQSSRSHTVFTIVVHMKENSREGEELVKIGKLNLVDLAGSENISKAGSDNPAKRERARECVNINQSLLTLGRVITALVERHPHIPYRESKLTRILQESLGGRTKTSIIATISPGHKDLEETMSTLEYANRAKNIQNKPEVNQKMTKKAILKDYAEEIDRLKRDLHAAREKNGVHLANEIFTEMILKQEEQRKEIQELLLKKRAMEEERDRMESVFRDLNCQLQGHQDKLSKTTMRLCKTENALVNTTNMLNTTKLHYEEQKHLVGKQAEIENVLSSQAKELLAVADAASSDVNKLQNSVDKRKSVESMNLEITRTYREVSAQHRNNIIAGTDNIVASLTLALADIEAALETYTNANIQGYSENKQKLEYLVQKSIHTMNTISSLKSTIQADVNMKAKQHCVQFREALQLRMENMQNILDKFAVCHVACLNKTGEVDFTASVTQFLKQWQNATSTNVTSLRSTHSEFEASVRNAAGNLLSAARRQQHERYTTCQRLENDILGEIAFIKEDEDRTKQYLEGQVLEIEHEKTDFDARFAKRAEEERMEFETRFAKRLEEERRLLEERLQHLWTSERNILEVRMKKKLENIEYQKTHFEKKMANNIEWLNEKLTIYRRETQSAGEDLKNYEKELEVCLLSMKNFVEQCEMGCTAIASNLDRLSTDAVNVVEQVKVDLLTDLQETQTQIQNESTALIQQNQQTTGQLAEDSDKMLEALVQNYQCTMDAVVSEVNGATSSTIEELSSMSAVMASLTAACHSHKKHQKLTLSTAQREVKQFYGRQREEVVQLEDLERRCLNQEYMIYSPTGNTPVRSEYKYPRTLVATSPHGRILARFRAMRQNSADDDCVLIEDEGEARSDAESSTSEDSAVAFAVPSPPANHNLPIVKSTSESDIYLGRRQQDQQGKENSNRSIPSMSFKKPLKLPAPTSLMKPLYERNTDN